MPKKSPRNKTIDFDLDQGQPYLDRTIQLHSPVDWPSIQDKTVVGDTFEVMPLLPRAFADLIIVDPPYNLSKDYHGHRFKKTEDQLYEDFTHQWLDQVIPLLKDQGSLYVCSDWETSLIIGPILKKKLNLQNRITWQREKGRGAKNNWKNGMEDIWFATKSADYYFNVEEVKIRRQVIAPYRENGQAKDWEETDQGKFRDTYPSNFWDDITIPFWSMAENTAHPTQKSEKLVAKLILASSRPHDIVFDPFLGSGTTSVTAKKLNRHYLGIEHNPLYAAWTEKRLAMAEEDPSIQGYVDRVFWERNAKISKKR